jgi:hypothetical protein
MNAYIQKMKINILKKTVACFAFLCLMAAMEGCSKDADEYLIDEYLMPGALKDEVGHLLYVEYSNVWIIGWVPPDGKMYTDPWIYYVIKKIPEDFDLENGRRVTFSGAAILQIGEPFDGNIHNPAYYDLYITSIRYTYET